MFYCNTFQKFYSVFTFLAQTFEMNSVFFVVVAFIKMILMSNGSQITLFVKNCYFSYKRITFACVILDENKNFAWWLTAFIFITFSVTWNFIAYLYYRYHNVDSPHTIYFLFIAISIYFNVQSVEIISFSTSIILSNLKIATNHRVNIKEKKIIFVTLNFPFPCISFILPMNAQWKVQAAPVLLYFYLFILLFFFFTSVSI